VPEWKSWSKCSRISKLASSAPRERSSVRPQNVVNLMDALRGSIAREKTQPPRRKKGGKRVAGQTEATDMASRFPGWSQSDSLTTSNALRRSRERLKPRSYLSSALASSLWRTNSQNVSPNRRCGPVQYVKQTGPVSRPSLPARRRSWRSSCASPDRGEP
jgi:hypothetical protein